jgi:hypothetical protein
LDRQQILATRVRGQISPRRTSAEIESIKTEAHCLPFEKPGERRYANQEFIPCGVSERRHFDFGDH